MMSGTVEAMELLSQQGHPLSRDALYQALGNCKDLSVGRRLQVLIVVGGFATATVLGNHLIRLFALHGSLLEANLSFCMVNSPDLYSWHSILSAYADLDEDMHTFSGLCRLLQHEGTVLNQPILLCMLKACGASGEVQQGRLVHDHIIQGSVSLDVIGNALIDMYMRCRSLVDSYKVFDRLPRCDIVAWNTMIAGHVKNGNDLLALELYMKMLEQDITPNKVTFACVLGACRCVGGHASLVEQIYNHILRYGVDSDMVIGNTLIDMYAKYGRLREAHMVFDKLSTQDIVSWGALIACYIDNGYFVDALKLFTEMSHKGFYPNKVIFLCALSACGSLRAIEKGWLLHDQVVKSGYEKDVAVRNALLDVYIKCEQFLDAHILFNVLPNKDVVSWAVMMEGYTQHGLDLFTFEHFETMQCEGLKPDEGVFACILKSCANVGSIKYGMIIHDKIIRSGLTVEDSIGTSLVGMYSRCGKLEEARRVFSSLQHPNAMSWGCIFAAYCQNSNYALRINCLIEMQQHGLKLDTKALCTLLSSCSHAGKVEEGLHFSKSLATIFNLTSNIEYFCCIIDLLSRAGRLADAETLLQTTPFAFDVIMLMPLLTGCKSYGHMDLGKQCFDKYISLDADTSAGYMLMSCMYITHHMWEDAYKTESLRLGSNVWNKPGKAWIELNTEVQEFSVGCQMYPWMFGIRGKLKRLIKLMKVGGCDPHLGLVLDQGWGENIGLKKESLDNPWPHILSQ